MSSETARIQELLRRREELKCSLVGLKAANKAIEEENIKADKEIAELDRQSQANRDERLKYTMLINSIRNQEFHLKAETLDVKTRINQCKQDSANIQKAADKVVFFHDRQSRIAHIVKQNMHKMNQNSWLVARKQLSNLLNQAKEELQGFESSLQTAREEISDFFDSVEDENDTPLLSVINKVVRSALDDRTFEADVLPKPRLSVPKVPLSKKNDKAPFPDATSDFLNGGSENFCLSASPRIPTPTQIHVPMVVSEAPVFSRRLFAPEKVPSLAVPISVVPETPLFSKRLFSPEKNVESASPDAADAGSDFLNMISGDTMEYQSEQVFSFLNQGPSGSDNSGFFNFNSSSKDDQSEDGFLF